MASGVSVGALDVHGLGKNVGAAWDADPDDPCKPSLDVEKRPYRFVSAADDPPAQVAPSLLSPGSDPKRHPAHAFVSIASARIQARGRSPVWIPACAGMTDMVL